MSSASLAEPLVALLEDERGIAALEVALLMPMLVALLLGAADVAITAARAREVEALAGSAAKAAQVLARDLLPPAGTRTTNGAGGLINNIPITLPPSPAPLPALAIGDLIALPPDIIGSVALFRGCPSAAGIDPVLAPACPGGVPAAAFARIEVSAPVARLGPWPPGWLSDTVEARTVVRLD